MKSQLSELSALYDGELEPHELSPVIKAAVRDDELRSAWLAYGLIGDELRGESTAGAGMTAAVMAKLRAEPVVLAPNRLRVSRSHPVLALAASVAGVAVVAWLSLAGNPRLTPVEGQLATVSPAPTFGSGVTFAPHTLASTASRNDSASATVAPAPAFVRLPEQTFAAHTQPRVAQAVATAPAARGDMSEYLLAHHIQASTFRLHDSTEHVRSVSMANKPSRP
jgi:negative regulator of sigma E activity